MPGQWDIAWKSTAPRPLRLERVSNFARPKLSNFARSKSLTLNFGQHEDTLVLTGVPDSGTIVKGNVILGKIGDDWYCRRVVDVAKSGDIWNLTTIPATWDEVYEQCAISATGTGYVEEEPTGVRSVKTLNTSRTGSPKGRSFRLYAEGGIEAAVSVNPSLHFEYERYKVNGKVRERYAYVGRLDLGAELGVHGTVGARMSKEFKTPFHIVIPTPVPGVTLENEWLAYIEGDAHIKGSASKDLLV